MARTKGITEAGSRRRTQILHGAEALIEAAGFDDLTMEAIAESIDVAKSTLYHYFPQKEDMLFAIYEETMEMQTTNLRVIVESGKPVKEQLRLAILDQLWLIAEHPGRVRVLMDARRDKERFYRAEMAKLERAYLDALAALLKHGMTSGEFRTANPVVVAEAILGMTQHSRYWLHPERPGGYKGVAKELWQLLCDGLNPA